MPTAVETAVNTKVFIVDDAPAIRASLSEMLQHVANANVVGEAASPDEAIEGILDTLPDVVILDLHLVGGSGLSVLRTVHPQLPDTLFLVLTNHPTAQYRRLCLEAGASYFLDKSNEFIRVIELIRYGTRGERGVNLQMQSQH